MTILSVRRARVRPVAFLLLYVLTFESCTSWAKESRSAPAVLDANPRSSLRIVRSSGARETMEHASVVGDSLRGTAVGLWGRHRDAIALADIRTVEVRQFDGVKTAAFVVGAGVTVALIAAVIARTPVHHAGIGETVVHPSGSYSCPLVYTWDGTNWRLDSGTFGGAIAEALQRTDVDNLDFATPVDGVLRLKVANELDETDYVDALHVIAVDHEPGVSVAPDAAGKLHTFGAITAPIRATDFGGHDALARVRSADGWNWESVPTGRDTSRAEDIRDGLELTFVRPGNAQHAHLVLDGNNTPWAAAMLGEFVAAHGSATQTWYDSLNANPGAAHAMGAQIAREAFLGVSVWAGDRWTQQGMYWEAGPEVRKRQALDLDLSMVRGDTVHVRLESVPSFWLIDRVGIDYTSDRAVTTTELRLVSALDRKGANISARISDIDHKDYALEHGDAAELQFAVPPVPVGQSRTFMLQSTGWYHVNTPVTAAPNAELLRQVAHGQFGISKIAVSRMNDALRRMADASSVTLSHQVEK